MNEVWERFCAVLEARIGAEAMDVWIRNQGLQLEALRADRVRLKPSSRYFADWIRENYRAEIEAAWEAVIGRPMLVEWVGLEDPPPAVALAEPLPPPPPAKKFISNVEKGRTFETFVVGKSNEFAHAAAMAVADAPGQAHNPLFIYGGTGLGKTHLMHAIGNRILAQNPNAGICYYPSQNFFDAMVRALQTRTITEFRERFRTDVDVLMLDDVQFLAGRDRTEEELFYIFEVMKASGRQIILTADEPPRDIGKLEPRLRTRFEGGLLADVQPPDMETMLAILRNKAEAAGLGIPSDVQHAIAQHVRNSVRELEGVINRLRMLQNFYARPITMSLLQERMADIVPPPSPPPSAEQIINKVSEHFHIRPSEIRGSRRPSNIAHPRQVAMYLTRKITELSFPEIGREFGRDNSTVQYACKKMEEEMKINPNLRAELELLEKLCRGG